MFYKLFSARDAILRVRKSHGANEIYITTHYDACETRKKNKVSSNNRRRYSRALCSAAGWTNTRRPPARDLNNVWCGDGNKKGKKIILDFKDLWRARVIFIVGIVVLQNISAISFRISKRIIETLRFLPSSKKIYHRIKRGFFNIYFENLIRLLLFYNLLL